MDLQDIQEFDHRDKYGTRAAYRNNNSLSQRYSLNMGREASKKKP